MDEELRAGGVAFRKGAQARHQPPGIAHRARQPFPARAVQHLLQGWQRHILRLCQLADAGRHPGQFAQQA